MASQRPIAPSDHSLYVGSTPGTFDQVIAVAGGVNDPKQPGLCRAKVRFVGHEAQLSQVPDECLRWGTRTDGAGTLQGTGTFEPTIPGTMYCVQQHGSQNQEVTIMNPIPTSEPQGEEATQHPALNGNKNNVYKPEEGPPTQQGSMKYGWGQFTLQQVMECQDTMTARQIRSCGRSQNLTEHPITSSRDKSKTGGNNKYRSYSRQAT